MDDERWDTMQEQDVGTPDARVGVWGCDWPIVSRVGPRVGNVDAGLESWKEDTIAVGLLFPHQVILI